MLQNVMPEFMRHGIVHVMPGLGPIEHDVWLPSDHGRKTAYAVGQLGVANVVSSSFGSSNSITQGLHVQFFLHPHRLDSRTPEYPQDIEHAIDTRHPLVAAHLLFLLRCCL